MRIFFLLLLFFYQNLFSQNLEETYLLSHSQKVDLDNTSFQLFEEEFYQNDLFFFGFIHGSATPQILDYELLVHLYKKGVRYYAPEIGYSYAFFLNHYLETGNESYLNYVLEDEVRTSVPQDASLEFKEKWKKIYRFNKNKKLEDRIKVIGADSDMLNVFHLAHLAPTKETGIELIDSLHYFKKLPKYKNTTIWSGKNISKSGKSWYYFFPESHKSAFTKRFLVAYKKDKKRFLEAFDTHAKEVEIAVEIHEQIEGNTREEAIFLNFKKLVLPLIERGTKVYANYGFAHVLQEKINGFSYIAKRLKDNLDNNIKLTTILGLLANSEVLKGRKAKKGEKKHIKGYKFHGVKYDGYKTSKFWDGDSILERVKGIKMLKRIAQDNDVTLFKLNDKNSPFNESLFFVNYTRYRASLFRKGRWETEGDSSTTDYFQYLLFIQNSKSNSPFPAE